MEADSGRDQSIDAALRSASTVPELMRTAARLATEAVDGHGCAISRMLGDVLDELGFTSLLMVPICAGNDVWGLAEVYREGVHRFVDADAERAMGLFTVVGERVAELEGGR